ncbi:MAG: phosphotransferase [Eggerthellaceae bacterium]|nr:phosphotransferase [Eggerthellaceae bacterium]
MCHNDFYAPNFLVHPEGVDLIDWEYSAMSDYASDLGTFICCSDYGIPEAEDVIREYFQRDPEPAEMRHCMAYVGLSAYYWFVWALYKERTGDPVGEWLYLWYRMAKTFGMHAQTLYQA